MQQFNTLKLRNELLKNLSFPETEKHINVTETNKKILSLAFFPFFQNFIYFSVSCKSVSSATPSLKVTVQFETEGNGQNEIVSHVDRSEVNLSISEKKYCDISYTERDFETETFHRKWVWGDAKTFKSFFLETNFMSKLWDTQGFNSGSFSSTDLKCGRFIAK